MTGYGYGGWQNCCNYESPSYGNCNNSSTFVLIVVLFILLIIVGSVFV